MRKGGLAAMIRDLSGAFCDLSLVLEMADQNNVRGDPGQVVRSTLQQTAALVNTQARADAETVVIPGVLIILGRDEATGQKTALVISADLVGEPSDSVEE